jgi:hypothetical protein
MKGRRIYVMSDYDDGYGMTPTVFGLLAECVNSLLDSDDFELSEIGNRPDYAPGALVTLFSARFQYQIEVTSESGEVTLGVMPMDAAHLVTMFKGVAAEERSWDQIRYLVLTHENASVPPTLL